MNNFLSTRSGSIAYIESPGEGQPVLFLHANSTCKEIFAKQFSSSLAQNYRLVAFDLPGHGESLDAEDPQGTYTMSHYAELVADVCHELVIDRPVLVGSSLGGHIAIEAACRRPDFYRGLVIAGTPPIGPGLDAVQRAFLPCEQMELTGKASFSAEESMAYAQATFGKKDLITDQLLQAVVRTDGLARETMLGDWMSHADSYAQAEFVESWRAPIGVIHGKEDPFVSLDYLQSLRWRNLWSGKVHVLDTGHVPFFEEPGRCNELLSQFLGDLKMTDAP